MNKERKKGTGWRWALSVMAVVGGLSGCQRGQEPDSSSLKKPTPVTTPTLTREPVLFPPKKTSSPINIEPTAETLTPMLSNDERIIFSGPTETPPTNITQGTEGSGLTAMGFIYPVPETAEEVQEPIVYTVKEGDTLTSISLEHNNIPVEIIYGMNSQVIGDNPDLIRSGQELLLVRWGSVEASRYLASKRVQEAVEKGKTPDWIYFTLTSELSTNEVADFFGISAERVASLNEIDDPNIKLPKDYYLMVPIGEGFVFTEADREEGRRWQPIPGIPLGAIWWESPTGEKDVGPSYPNIAYTLIPCPVESWVDATWSTADELSERNYISETVTDVPANRTWEIVDKDGKITYEKREGFLVYGKRRISHTGYRKIEAGKWIFTKSISSE